MISVLFNRKDIGVSRNQEEVFEKYNTIIKWGRKNPVKFIEHILGIRLMDYQKWIIDQTWTAEYIAWVCSRNAGKSFLGAVYMMTRAILFPNLRIRIFSATASQANDTFGKIEDIAKGKISSIGGDNSVFRSEIVVRNGSTGDGFLHDDSHFVELFNGSTIKTVIGTEKTARGERSNLSFYDEAGSIDMKFFKAIEPMAAQNKDFRLGGDIDNDIYPKDVPNQQIYASSADSVNSYLYSRYKEFAKKMIMGFSQYFVADVNCEIPLAPTCDGEPTKPLLKQKQIDDAMADDPENALREYYNIFDKTGGINSLVKRSDIIAAQAYYLPVFKAEDEKKMYIIAYDPASQNDNSFVLVTEVYKNEAGKYCGKIVHGINLAEKLSNGSKKPMIMDRQIQEVRNLLVNFSYPGIPDYSNIIFLLDAGSGGSGPVIAQELWKDFVDNNGVIRSGIIDSGYDEKTENAKLHLYPRAVDCAHELNPSGVRTQAFEAVGFMVGQGLISFPAEPPKNKIYGVGENKKRINDDEFASLVEINAMKEEIIHFVKEKDEATGKVKYRLEQSLRKRGHDDRAYCLALTCYWIRQMGVMEELGGVKIQQDFSNFIKNAKEGKQQQTTQQFYGHNKRTNFGPFMGNKNPFNFK